MPPRGCVRPPSFPEALVLYKTDRGKIRTRALEYSVAYHCNLRCAGCSHMSPFIAPQLPPLESFTRDANALATAVRAREIRLLGGEPLLHPQIVEFLRAAKSSGVADWVIVSTNG